MAPSRQSTGSAIVRFYDPDVQAKDALGRTLDQILAWNNSQLEYSHNYIQVLFPLPEGSPFNWSAPVIDLDTMKAFRANGELRQQLRRSFERMLTFYGFTASINSEHVSGGKKEVGVQEHPSTETASKITAATAEPVKKVTQDAQPPPPAAEVTTSQNGEEDRNAASSVTKAVHHESTSRESPLEYLVVRGDNWQKASRNWCVRFDHNHLRITRILRCLRVLGLQDESEAFFAALKGAYEDPTVGIGARSMEFWTRAVKRPLHLPPDDMEDECEWLKTWAKEQGKKA